MVRFPLPASTEPASPVATRHAADFLNTKRVLLADVAQSHTLTMRGIRDYVGLTTQTEASQVVRSGEVRAQIGK